MPFEKHLFKNYYGTKQICNIELPNEGDTMAFFSYKNLLERPWTVYAEFESSLIPAGEEVTIYIHKANSAWCLLYALLTVQQITI